MKIRSKKALNSYKKQCKDKRYIEKELEKAIGNLDFEKAQVLNEAKRIGKNYKKALEIRR